MKRMQSRYSGTCGHCHKAIKRGETIGYDGRTRTAYHDGCVKLALAENPRFDGQRADCSQEDACCGSAAYENACASACGF